MMYRPERATGTGGAGIVTGIPAQVVALAHPMIDVTLSFTITLLQFFTIVDFVDWSTPRHSKRI